MKTYRYAVLRLVPSLLRQEFINVGVVVVPADGPAVVQICPRSHSRRLRAFGYEGDFEMLESVRRDIQAWGRDASKYLIEASAGWAGSIRLSEVRAARHESPSALCGNLYTRYVRDVEDAQRVPNARDRRYAKKFVREVLQSNLPDEAVQNAPVISGKAETHRFDLGVRNGNLLHAVTTLSFDIKTERVLSAEIDACAWSISDVREVEPSLPISVVTIGDAHSKLLSRAANVYESLSARLVGEDEIEDWAEGVETAVRPHLNQQTVPTTSR